MAEQIWVTADPNQITSSSSATQKAEAMRQLAAARAEWNSFLKSHQTMVDYGNGVSLPDFNSGDPNVSWRQVAEPKLNEILQKYPYVTTYQNTGKLVEDRLAVKTDGSISSPTLNPPPLGNTAAQANADDAYPLSQGSKGLPRGNETGSSPYDPNNLKAPSGPGPGSSVSDSPDLAGQTAKPSGAAPTAPSRAGPPNEYEAAASGPAPGNQTPVTNSNTTGTNAAAEANATTPSSGNNGNGTAPSGNTTGQNSAATDDSGKGTGMNGTEPRDSGTTGNGSVTTDGTVAGGSSAGETPLPRKINVRPNILHSYANWTYQIGWYMLDTNTHNDFVNTGQDTNKLRQRPIMKSGGFKKSSSGMTKDLYLQSLRFTSVIGNNKASPNANMFSIEMSVVEPYGVSLLADLKKMADELGGSQQHLQIPYLLEFKFLGYDDTGKIVTNIPNSGPKLVPVTIINITFNITSAGTVYNVTMVPTGQAALNTNFGVVRERLQLYGGNLNEILVTGASSLAQALNDQESDALSKGLCQYKDEYKFVVKSFNPSRSETQELINSPITFKAENSDATLIYKRGMPAPTATMMGNDPTRQYYEVPGGSNIKDVVQRLVMITKYFQDRVTPEAPNSQKDKPMELIKVIPVVELGEFDKIRQRYQRKVTYKITTFFKYGEIHPAAGQATVDNGVLAKEYNWLFTGKNDDIINMDLQFNVAYFRIFQNASPSVGAAQSGTVTLENKAPPSSNPSPSESTMAVTNTQGKVSNTTLRGAKDTAVQEYFDQQLNSPDNADLVALDITIIGDPDWIPQDLSVRPQGAAVRISSDGFINGSIATDVEAVYAKIKFKTPRDYSDTTGLMELTTDQTQIGGVYQVITADSAFEAGKFTQTLHLVRAPNQVENKPSSSTASGTNAAREANATTPVVGPGRGFVIEQPGARAAAQQNNSVTVQQPAPPTPANNFTGSSILTDDGMGFGGGGL